MRFNLIRHLAKALAKNGARFLLELALPGSAALYQVAEDVWEDCRREQREANLRVELEGLARAKDTQIRQEVLAAVQAEASGLPPKLKSTMAAYLAQVPAQIRTASRRPADPTGTSLPGSLAIVHAEDLLPFLPPRPPRFQPGDRPSGMDWVLEKLLGIGGFGEVWKARHPYMRSKPPVALKFCLDKAAVPATENEVAVLDLVMAHGKHPGIVPLLNTHLSAEPPCLEYEYVEGGDLAALIQEMHASGRVPPVAATRLLLRLTDIVAFAHKAQQPIVHCDLKPANVLVRRGKDGKMALRVTDFGIGGLAAVRAVRESSQPGTSRHKLLTDAVRGAYTPLYASPEQIRRQRGEAADPRDDVHALGVIWYQLVTGDLRLLNIPTDWREQLEKRGLAAVLIKLLAACIAPHAEARPANAVTLAAQVRAGLAMSEAPVVVFPAEPDDLEVVPDELEVVSRQEHVHRQQVRYLGGRGVGAPYICPHCRGTRFTRSVGLKGSGHFWVMLVLCLFYLLPGILYYMLMRRPLLRCHDCSKYLWPKEARG
jgi:protein kinase-like protein